MKNMLCLLGSLLSGLSIAIAGTLPIVSVAPHQKIVTIHLPANPTTGYQWTVKTYDQKYLTFIKQEYKAKNKHLIGGGGEAIFYFNSRTPAKRPAYTAVTFSYARSWEKNTGKITTIQIVFE